MKHALPKILFVVIMAVALMTALFGSRTTMAASTSLVVTDVWARPGGAGHTSAAYMKITNVGTDDLVLISAEAEIAARVELHETTLETSIIDGKITQVMRMDHIPQLLIEAGATVELRQGGLHVMFIGLTKDLVEGEMFTLTLTTADASLTPIVLHVPVMPAVGGGSEQDHHDHDHDHTPEHGHAH